MLLIHCLVIGVLGGIVSQFGDLTASIFKRKMGIKDYGHLIPGHGGILDRFDSVLFTAPDGILLYCTGHRLHAIEVDGYEKDFDSRKHRFYRNAGAGCDAHTIKINLR